MCGIFGIASKEPALIKAPVLDKAINSLFLLSESRGKEASGIAFVSDNEIKVLKQNVSASKFIRTPLYKSSLAEFRGSGATSGLKKTIHPLSVIGHSRLATNGCDERHFNNQPVICDGMTAVHNGIVVNDQSLWNKYPFLQRRYEVDTEIVLSLLRLFYQREHSIEKATVLTFQEIRGATSIAVLFEDLNCLLLATNNGSLYTCIEEDSKTVLFASEAHILEALIKKNAELRKVLRKFKIEKLLPGNAKLIDLSSIEVKDFDIDHYQEVQDGTIDPNVRPCVREITDIFSHRPVNMPLRIRTPGLLSTVPLQFQAFFQKRREEISLIKRCTKCLLPETMPFNAFDERGVCLYCNNYRPLKHLGAAALDRTMEPYRNSKARCDSIVCLSGGRDSSYSLHYMKNVLGMNPIAYTYDWGMITDLARRNISRICGKLRVEHILISADLRKKRENIRKNVSAWLHKPDLGMVPLFTAGDKQFFYYGNRLKRQFGAGVAILAENLLEKTCFKSGFCAIPPYHAGQYTYSLSFWNKLKLVGYYSMRCLQNPRYFNLSMLDTWLAFYSYYLISHNFLWLYDYLPWIEEDINSTLVNEYDWEVADDALTTWRIGDGTAAFYNYIYYIAAGFTENDTFRSNQIREGLMTREEAQRRIENENFPRWEAIKWYCDTVNIDFESAVKSINNMPRIY